MDTLEKNYQDIMNQFFPETAHKIPIYKASKLDQVHPAMNEQAFERFIKTNKSTIITLIKSVEDLKPIQYEEALQKSLLSIAHNIHEYDPDTEKSIDWLSSFLPEELKNINSQEKELEVSEKSITMHDAQQTTKTLAEIKKTLSSIMGALNTVEKTKKGITKSDPLNQIRIRQRDPKIFSRKTLRTIPLSKSLGIEAVVGELPGDTKTRIQTLIFNKDNKDSKVWSLKEAKSWTKAHKERIKVSVDIKELLQKAKKIVTKEPENV